MRTKTHLENIIRDTEEWLKVNSKEHEARPAMELKLKNAKLELQNKST